MNVRRLSAGLIGAVLIACNQGCCVTTFRPTTLPEGNVRRLLQSYPVEAEKARVAAPAFTRDALLTISGLEEEGAVLRLPR